MSEKRKRRFWLTLACSHFLLVIFGVTHVDLLAWGPVGSKLWHYSAFTGANNGFGFFGRGVFSQFRAVFEITHEDGRVTTASLERGKSKEEDTRVANLVSLFGEDLENKKFQRAVTASWAGKMFARHKDATAVIVRLETYDLPSMAGYREGRRGGWRLFYESKYRLSKQKGTKA